MSSTTGGVKVDVEYIKSPPGILKIVEFVLLLIAFACLSGYSGSTYHFAMFIFVTLWLVVIGLFVFFLLQLHLQINAPWMILLVVFHGVASLALLLASSLIADDARDFHKRIAGYCKYYTICSRYDAATAFGFFSLIAFLLDLAFYVWKLMNAHRGAEGQKPDDAEKPVEPQPIA